MTETTTTERMSTVMITEFLTARLDEDEAVARAAFKDRERDGMDPGAVDDGVWTRGSHASDECLIEGVSMTIYDEGGHGPEDAEHIVRWHPARVLAEVSAKRRIVEIHDLDPVVEYSWGMTGGGCGLCDHSCETGGNTWGHDPCETLKSLALPYADHADYRDEWRPAS